MLRALIGPKVRDLLNTLSITANITANIDAASLLSFFVFLILYLPPPPEKLQTPFRITFVLITGTMFAMLNAISTGMDMAALGPKYDGPPPPPPPFPPFLLFLNSVLHANSRCWNQ